MSSAFAERYGPWAIVTGASSGIGEAFADVLAERGLRVLLVARREAELQRVAEDVRARHGVECGTLALDLADRGFIDALMARCEGLDVGLVIGNAGFNPPGGFLDVSIEDRLRMVDVNDRANVLLADAFLPRLRQRGRGGFLLVGSVEGYFGAPWSAVYSASKAFVLSFGEALWGEFRETGVDVLVLSPGATDTPLLETRKLGERGVPLMTPRAVAQIGLDHLGRGPSVIPGFGNRLMFRILRWLPRRWTVPMIGGAIRKVVEGARLK